MSKEYYLSLIQFAIEHFVILCALCTENSETILNSGNIQDLIFNLRIRWDFRGQLDQLYHFMDKEIWSLEMLSPLFKVTQKLVAEVEWEFNVSDSRSMSLFIYSMVPILSEFKTRVYIMTVWFDLNGNSETEYSKSKLFPQIWHLITNTKFICLHFSVPLSLFFQCKHHVLYFISFHSLL